MHKETLATADPKEPYMAGYRAGWNDALHEVKVELLDGVAGHHWLALQILKIEHKLKKR